MVSTVPSFVNRVTLTLAGEDVKIQTAAWDQLNAERAIGAGVMEHPVELGMQVWFSALKRQHPDHEAARNFRTFVESLEAAEEEDTSAGPEEMDPTRPAASAG
jgi:prophage DNA circulation protein